MNKQEKLIAIFLGLCLAGWLWHSVAEQKKAAEAAAKYAAAHPTSAAEAARPAAKPAATVESVKKDVPSAKAPEAKSVAVRAPEKTVTLATDEVELVLTTHGGAIKCATMKKYGERPGAIGEGNPELKLDFAGSPALALEGVDGMGIDADFVIESQDAGSVTFANSLLKRRITLKPGYRIELEETFAKPDAAAVNRLSTGAIAMGSSKNDMLSIDSWLDDPAKPKVQHHGELDPLKSYLVASMGGCGGGSKNASGIPEVSTIDVPGRQRWIAVKNRFFVAALVSSTAANAGFRATVRRDMKRREYAPSRVAAAAAFDSLPATRSSVFYIGPKKLSLLWSMDMRDVMEFGMWRWLCYPLVWVLNLFNSLIPNYGVAIILLTILVRLVFWPLTHKSTMGMRRMQEIQPKMKEIQAKFKDNPQRLQQETMALYRNEKVNPLSSCLPMLVQIPVFIALFTVLRSAVELRYAPFLWISDLSEPEALFSSWFPFGGLNILPLAMAALTMLQSAFTPTSGDNKQQRMMMVMMPLMMLFMFYNFPSALSLYWALSTAFSVAQAWWIKRRYGTPAAKTGSSGVIEPDSVEMPITRQMRRHGN